jgi:hypothetical protein
MVDVSSDITIDRPLGVVATYTADPSNAPEWYANISSVVWESEPLVEVGSKVALVAQYLGRTLSYTYEIVEFVPRQRLVMRTAQGPFPMETTYLWSPRGEGATHMTLRNRGEPKGFSRTATPFISSATRRSNRKDLQLLKTILESRNPAE